MSQRRALVAAALFLVVATGCSLFETRSPVKPPPGSSFFCFTLDNKDNVYANILRAYGRGDGLVCYLSNLDDAGFKFHPDPTDSAEDTQGLFLNWNKNVEDVVTSKIAGAVTSLFLQFKGDPLVLPGGGPDDETRRYTYEIQTKGGIIADTLFQGLADISIHKGAGGQWQVTDWFDRRDPNGTTTRTWGYLRSSYRTGS